jgi:hypothetical protein
MSKEIHELSSGNLDAVSGGWKYFAPPPSNPSTGRVVPPGEGPGPVIPTHNPFPVTNPVGFINT